MEIFIHAPVFKNIMILSIRSKAIYRSKAIPIRISKTFLSIPEKIMLKFIWECKTLRSWGYHNFRFQTSYRAVIIKTAYYWNKN